LGELLRDYETDFFLQLAFVNLFPYGRGGPEPNGAFKVSAPYLSHLLNLGGQREFQQSPNFIFYAYSWKMKHRAGTISFLATKNGQTDVDPVNISVADAKEFLTYIDEQRTRSPYQMAVAARRPAELITETKMRMLLNRLLPYAGLMAGTQLFMQSERKKLLSMISSAVTNRNSMWAYFFTEAQADIYLSELYDNAITSSRKHIKDVDWRSPVAKRRADSKKLIKAQRAIILRDHPMLSARLHVAQQDVFWQYVVHGTFEPFGEVKDYWRRVEFQERGTPHSHNLINIATVVGGIQEDSLSKQGNAAETKHNRELVTKTVQEICTARLQPRDPNDFCELSEDTELHAHERSSERGYLWRPERQVYFKDVDHPCREPFNASDKEFDYDKTTGKIEDTQVQSLYRRLQIANQMHVCHKSCYKYCKTGQELICRYSFPKPVIDGNFDAAMVVNGRDARGRIKVTVQPPRTNGHLNTCCVNPLILLACKGNHDIQYIANKSGGAEYASKYVSKTDTADCKAMVNAMSRKLAHKTISLAASGEPLTLQMVLRAVANTLATAQQVGSVHACYIISHSNKVVQSSRGNLYVNALKRSDITERPLELDLNVLDCMDDEDDAVVNSVRSQFGKRDAYYEFYKYHCQKFHGKCPVDFYAFLSAYRLVDKQKYLAQRGEDFVAVEGLEDELIIDQTNGFVINPVSFYLGSVSC
jgi:hypothetical protein